MATTQSYYDILGVPKTATPAEIEKAFKKLVRKYHPDKAPASKKEEYSKIMADINKANTVLSDPDAKEKYDMFGDEGPAGHGGADVDDMDVFAQMMGMMGQNEHASKRNKKPKSIVVQFDINLEDAYKGVQAKKSIVRKSCCEPCAGTGSKDKKSTICKDCRGCGTRNKTKKISATQFTMRTVACEGCDGTGNTIVKANICQACNGKKLVDGTYEASFYIKKGIAEGTIVTLSGEGNENSESKVRGDILIKIGVREHPYFKRNILKENSRKQYSPLNLSYTVELTLAEALCGFRKEIKHLDNRVIPIIGKDQVNSGDVIMIVGEGLPGSSGDNGDLYIKFTIKNTVLSEVQKNQIHMAITGSKREKVDLKNATPYSKSNDVKILSYSETRQVVEQYNQYENKDFGGRNEEAQSGCSNQ
jgi:DnaJ-class molecular chaperone